MRSILSRPWRPVAQGGIWEVDVARAMIIRRERPCSSDTQHSQHDENDNNHADDVENVATQGFLRWMRSRPYRRNVLSFPACIAES
jgi:hypothetical protein